jgi:hypothetical protein
MRTTSRIMLFSITIFLFLLPHSIFAFIFRRNFLSLTHRQFYNFDYKSSHATSSPVGLDNSVSDTSQLRREVSEQPNLFLFNTLSGKKELFQPLKTNKVTMYTCGPTVYDDVHIGNFRAMLFYDILKRVLLYFGYDVEHVCNLTDVDDKIIDKMFQEGKIHRKNITDKYITSFFKGLEVVLDCSTIVTFVELSPINTNPCSF